MELSKSYNKFYWICENNFRYFRDKYPFVQISAGLIHQHVIWTSGDHELGTDKLLAEPFPVYSVSKLYTMLCFFAAEKENRVALEDPITKYLPQFELKYEDVNCASSITFEHLLSHTSGLQHEASVGNNFFMSNSVNEHIDSINESQLLFFPGKNYNYSNLNYDLIGYILSQIYGICFETLICDLVLDKLEMTDTYYQNINICQNPSWGMVSSIQDLLKSLRAFTDQEYSKNFFRAGILDRVQRIFNVKVGQYSGFGLGMKIIRVGNTFIGILTGMYSDNFIEIMWSQKYKLGFVLYFSRFDKRVLKELDDYDVFYNLISELENISFTGNELFNTSYYYPYICLDKIGSYLSCDNHILYIKETDSCLFLNCFGEDWIPLQCLEENKFVTVGIKDVLEVQFEMVNNDICAVYVNGYSYFNYFYRNDPPNTNDPKYQGTKYLRFLGRYCLDISRTSSREERQRISLYNRISKIEVTCEQGWLYLNKKYRLIHIRDHLFKKVNGEPVCFGENYVIVGNIRYDR
ncbi:serine hydrolase domain-containing protein [Paenibacillus sp. IHBB 10380]|uniref:serine hydrolase domain-containing protein n=1 Tax=Paenibacillus sp. IHBB 10380 TaxID=1566358 RepID=UPI0005CFB811|nr:serine hydrolase domain-containing protein [Paenibacillus sp. IHBB 10380]AJS57203.1 hypothetical protein UB51_00320 [Paenibacillus sp. IHBB 10380]